MALLPGRLRRRKAANRGEQKKVVGVNSERAAFEEVMVMKKRRIDCLKFLFGINSEG